MLSPPPLFKYRRYWLAALIVLLAILDPFGLASSSDKASAQWLNRMFASHYAHEGQQRVAVVLIDDAYLMRNATSWPMPYGEQSKLFKRLLAFKPKAVFVDLLYSHDHSFGDPARGSQLLANVFERYQRQGIPLWLANTGVVRMHRMSIGTITAHGAVNVQYLRGARLGSVEEAFMARLSAGDVFNFAGRSLVLVRLENNTAWVRRSAEVGLLTPAWAGSLMPMSSSLGERMQQLLSQAATSPAEDDAPHARELQWLQPLLQLQSQRSLVPVFEVADIEATVASLAARDAPVGAIRDMGSHGRTAMIRDPAGNPVQLFQRAPRAAD